MNEHRAGQGRDTNPNELTRGCLSPGGASDVCQCVVLETAAMCLLSDARTDTRTSIN